ncbi:hypothetical protein ANCDUO_02091 [Ancylostoma duodenale]|uniref:Uncharacterized protein n=1 Tax=Ancylostoma duodenale TaxID=51022 RepID=A0A0C2DCJ2_9BILA|nr:hypothetical protein ANCDUO_02091 [Ancylostoma duodenale]
MQESLNLGEIDGVFARVGRIEGDEVAAERVFASERAGCRSLLPAPHGTTSALCGSKLVTRDAARITIVIKTKRSPFKWEAVGKKVLSDKNPKFKNQPDVGITFNNNKDYIVYKTHSVAVEFLVS